MPNDYGLGDAEYSRDMMNPPEPLDGFLEDGEEDDDEPDEP